MLLGFPKMVWQLVNSYAKCFEPLFMSKLMSRAHQPSLVGWLVGSGSEAWLFRLWAGWEEGAGLL